MKTLFNGVCTALITPFVDGKIDYKSLKRLIKKQIKEGVDAICILGTTGESSTIDIKEREKIIKFCKQEINNKCKLLVGTGSNNYKHAYRYTCMAKRLKVDGVLVVTPYYNKTTQVGIFEYYKKLSEIGIPIIIYNVPSRTGLNIEISTIKRLLKLNNIVGIKEATDNICRIIDLCKVCKGKIAVYSGEDKLNFVFYVLGGSGCISVASNFYCQDVKTIYNFAQRQMIKKACNLQNKLNTINEVLFCETNPMPIKYLLAKMNLIKNELRLPLIPLSSKCQTRVDKAIEKYNKKSN